MKRMIALTLGATLLGTTALQAAPTTDEIVNMFPGAQRIEIERGFSQTEVEVYKDGQKTEITFDNATNSIVKREVEPMDADDYRDLEDGKRFSIEDKYDDDDDDDDEDDDHDDDDDDHDDDDHDDYHDDDDDNDDDDRDDDRDDDDDDDDDD